MTETENTSIRVKLLFYLVIADLAIILGAIFGRMLFGWQPLEAFYPFFYAAQAGLLLTGLGLLQGLYGGIRKQRPHLVVGLSAMGLGLSPLLAALLSVGIAGFQAPMIHDITTDMADPPGFGVIAALRTAEENSLDYEGEAVAALQREAFPDIQPLVTGLPPDRAHAEAMKVVRQLGWAVVVDDAATGTIEAYEETAVFGFIDDVVIRISAHDNGSRIDLRSVSRVGLGDLGANAERIRRFSRRFPG